MEVFQGLDGLVNVLGRLFLSKLSLLNELLVDFSASGILKNEIDLFLVPEEAIEPTNIVVAQVALDFNLFPELVFDTPLDKLLLVKDLEGDDELRSFFSGQVYMTELSSAHRLTDFEVIDGPLLRIEFFGSLELGRRILDLLNLLHLAAHLPLRIALVVVFSLVSNRLVRLIVVEVHLKMLLLRLRNRHLGHRNHVDVRRRLVLLGHFQIIPTHFLVDV